MPTAILLGSTGLVGKNILSTLLTLPSIDHITTISRRSPPPSAKINTITSADTSIWPTTISRTTPTPATYFSALGTTRGAAGSIAAQRLIDFDLNLALARAAHESGTKICVLISSAGANAGSMLPYAKMKGELEEAVRELGFRETVVVRPGLIVGKERSERSFGQWWAGNVAGGWGRVSRGWKDGWAQDADVIARAAVRAGVMALEGKGEGKEGWWVVGQADVVRLGAEQSSEK